jgi:pectate lyase
MQKTFTLYCFIFLRSLSNMIGQTSYMVRPEGFGAATTGGGSASPITVTTYSDLKTALTQSGSAVILVSGTIDFSTSGIIKAVISNKTLLGLPGARLVNTNQLVSGILYLSNGSTNVIIRNLIFEGPGAWDNNGNDNLTADGCTNLWVDHCEFQDGEDGNFDNKGKTDSVTISWCKFTYLKAPRVPGSGSSNDHRFSNLIGSGGTDAPTDGHFSITLQNNYWAIGCKERMPRARNAELHILNCYYNTMPSSTTALGIGGGTKNSTCYVENTDFASVGTVYKNYNGTDGGTVAITFSGCLKGVADVGTVTKPTYTYTTFPVANVAAAVADFGCGAGATLQITPNASISAGTCSNTTSISTTELLSNINCYPTTIDNVLNIDFSNTASSYTDIEIFAVDGGKVFSYSRNIAANDHVELNLSSLLAGAYLCTIKTENTIKKQTFMKR